MENEKTPASKLRRRVPFVFMVGALVVVVLHHMNKQPLDLQVIYEYGYKSHGLKSAKMVYKKDGDVYANVVFNYSVNSPADSTARHKVRLPKGFYTVEIALTNELSDKTNQFGSIGKISKLTRTFEVKEEGTQTIFISDSD